MFPSPSERLSVKTMRRLGKGWQYVVYENGNGRVLKRPRHFLSLFISVLLAPASARPLQSHSALRETRHLRTTALEAVKALSCRMANIDTRIVGNPIFFADGSYEQDRVMVVDTYLSTHSTSENRKIIDKYIELQMLCWEYGFADPGFDFAVNNGIDREGCVVQIDLGELMFSIGRIADAVRGQFWLGQRSFTHRIKDRTLKKYFVGQMSKFITLEALQAHWAKRIHDGALCAAAQ